MGICLLKKKNHKRFESVQNEKNTEKKNQVVAHRNSHENF